LKGTLLSGVTALYYKYTINGCSGLLIIKNWMSVKTTVVKGGKYDGDLLSRKI